MTVFASPSEEGSRDSLPYLRVDDLWGIETLAMQPPSNSGGCLFLFVTVAERVDDPPHVIDRPLHPAICNRAADGERHRTANPRHRLIDAACSFLPNVLFQLLFDVHGCLEEQVVFRPRR